MTLRETIEASKAAIKPMVERIAAEVSAERGQSIIVGDWEQRDPIIVDGHHSRGMGGEIVRLRIGKTPPNRESGYAVKLMPGPTGTDICLPEGLRDTEWLCWSDTDHPAVPYEKRVRVCRFCIGGDGTCGSGFLVRVVLDPDAGCLRISLPTDPRAAASIHWYDDADR